MKDKLYFKKKISCGDETAFFLFVLSSKTSCFKGQRMPWWKQRKDTEETFSVYRYFFKFCDKQNCGWV